MSLTGFLKIPYVKEVFKQEFPLPEVSLTGDMLAPPVTKHYSLIGTAFDYLLRFYLERLNQNKVIASPWVARYAVELAEKYAPSQDYYQRVLESLMEAEKHYTKYMETGIMNRDILKASILLARLDPIYRTLYFDKNIGVVEEGDLQDLANLIGIIKPEYFKAQYYCLLNPTFGEGSVLVHGADADIIIDGKLIDIKTTTKLKFTDEYYHQLVGYYILSKIGIISGLNGKITELGIYYSRYGILKTIPTRIIDEHQGIEMFIDWFVETAKKVFNQV